MATPEDIRVLHVDDEVPFAELTAEMLEREDDRITVETVTSASECLDHFFEREYDCIVSDYDISAMTGIELLERVREEDGDFPFILFTGKGSEEVASDAISAGVTDYLQKETNADQYAVLANRLTNAVEQYRAKQRLEERERELRRKQEYLDTILEHTTTPIFMKDHEGRYVFTNRAYREGFDIDGEIAGKTAHDVYPPELADTIEEYDRTVIETGEPIEFEGTEEIDGEERAFLTTLVPVSDTDEQTDQEDRIALFGVASDVTEFKRRERELKRERDRLAEFNSIVSHDLRNPLDVAQGRLKLASEECESDHLDHVARSLDRMRTLIDDLRTLAREGAPATDLEPVDLADVTEACWATVRTDNASLVVDTDATVRAVESRLQQLLENLIRNAVEHGSTSPRSQASEDAVEHGPTSSPTESDDAFEHGGTDVTITVGDFGAGFYVADDGTGIPAEERDDIFDAGYSTAADGTGFGLAIVEEIAEAHGWDPRVTESDDGGARFEITDVEFVD